MYVLVCVHMCYVYVHTREHVLLQSQGGCMLLFKECFYQLLEVLGANILPGDFSVCAVGALLPVRQCPLFTLPQFPLELSACASPCGTAKVS